MVNLEKGRLFVSFWHISLDNLPIGAFVHRGLSVEDARSLINEARREERLCCVSQDDLLAPYKQKALQNHRKLCDFLNTHLGITITIDDFVNPTSDDGEPLGSIIPLQCVTVREGYQLLVITCCYTLPDKDEFSTSLEFQIAEDSVEFHLFEIASE